MKNGENTREKGEKKADPRSARDSLQKQTTEDWTAKISYIEGPWAPKAESAIGTGVMVTPKRRVPINKRPHQ